jgi:uncharacterized protein (DUF1810 family)
VDDPYQLQRFLDAQDGGGSYDSALAELRAGHKRGHWMWFVFPQIAGLGRTSTSRFYAIGSLAEARAYLAHPILGPRLLICTRALTEHPGKHPGDAARAEAIFGGIDAMKLRSSMTLFAHADPSNPLFGEVLDTYFGGVADPLTEDLLSAGHE